MLNILHLNNITSPNSLNALKVTGKRVKRFGGNYSIFRSTKDALVDQKAHCEIVRHCKESNSCMK